MTRPGAPGWAMTRADSNPHDQHEEEKVELKKRVRALLPDIIRKLKRNVDRLRAQLEVIEGEQRQRCTTNTLLGSLPEDNSLLKVIRYETMLDRQIHRALDRLERLQRARRRRKKKKRTCETNPSRHAR